MRVLYLSPGCFDKGGISRYARYQIEALRGILGRENVRVLSLLGPDRHSLETPFSVDFHASGNSAADKLAFMTRAAAFAASERPALVIAAHVNLSAAALALAAPIRAETWLNVYGLEVWSGLRRDAALGLRRVGHVVADCAFTARWVREHGLIGHAQVRVVWDCVDVDRFSPGAPRREVLSRYGIPDPATGMNVLTLGRISSEAAHKGYDRLLDVFARVRATVSDIRLVIAGRGALIPALRDRAARLGIGEHVFFTDGIHEDDLPDVYRSAHAFSLVSDRGKNRGEGLPLAVLEAAASGVPVVVGNQDGSQEAVIEGENGLSNGLSNGFSNSLGNGFSNGFSNGFVVDPFDLDAHARRLIQLARDPAARAAMGVTARAHAVRAFSSARFFAEHRALLDEWFGYRSEGADEGPLPDGAGDQGTPVDVQPPATAR